MFNSAKEKADIFVRQQIAMGGSNARKLRNTIEYIQPRIQKFARENPSDLVATEYERTITGGIDFKKYGILLVLALLLRIITIPYHVAKKFPKYMGLGNMKKYKWNFVFRLKRDVGWLRNGTSRAGRRINDQPTTDIKDFATTDNKDAILKLYTEQRLGALEKEVDDEKQGGYELKINEIDMMLFAILYHWPAKKAGSLIGDWTSWIFDKTAHHNNAANEMLKWWNEKLKSFNPSGTAIPEKKYDEKILEKIIFNATWKKDSEDVDGRWSFIYCSLHPTYEFFKRFIKKHDEPRDRSNTVSWNGNVYSMS